MRTSTTEERRHSSTIFALGVLSISNLVDRARENLEEKVKSGELEDMPPVPLSEWVRLQFSPNNHTALKARFLTGSLGIVCAIQTRTLKMEHEDQHFVNAMTRYVLEWLIELRAMGAPAEFCGGDDKAKVAVGDEVVSHFTF